MKTKIFLAAITTMFCAAASSQTAKAPAPAASTVQPVQGILVVNSEKIFKALPEYNSAVKTTDDLATSRQKSIDDAYAAVQKMYDEYQTQRSYLNDAQRQQKEDAIIAREKEITKFQQDTFGPDGEVMKKRVAAIEPIQNKVFKAINDYAQAGKYSVVIDQANNASLLYFAPNVDKTDEIIKILTK